MTRKMSHTKVSRQSLPVRKTPFVPARPKTNSMEPQDSNPPSAVAQAVQNPLQPVPPIVGGIPPTRLHSGGITTEQAQYELQKGEHVSPAKKNIHYHQPPAGHSSPNSIQLREAQKGRRSRFDF